MVEVERYFGFGASDYEARGGFGDLVFRSDVLEDVVTALKKHNKSGKYIDSYWVIDMETFEPVDVNI